MKRPIKVLFPFYKFTGLVCTQNPKNTTSLSLREKMQEISRTLKLNKTSLSSEVRKKTCAEDPRSSAKYMGVMAGVIIGVYFGLILLVDCTSLLRRACSRSKICVVNLI